MAVTEVLGTVAMVNKGVYDSQTSYEKLNVVTYNGSSYCATQNTQGNLPTDTTYWQLLAEKGSGLQPEDVIDNLTSTLTTKPLSANQGKELKELVDDCNTLILKKPYYFNTVEEMKEFVLLEGDYVITEGYYSANDGGGATYKITDVESQTEYQEELNNGLYATLIIENKELNIKQFGAYGDNTHDDSNVFKKVFELLSKTSFYNQSIQSDYTYAYTLNIPNGNYLIEQTDLLSDTNNRGVFGLIIEGNKSKLIFNDFVGSCFINNNKQADIEYNNLTFISINDNKDRILFDNYSTGKVQNLKFNNCHFSGTWKNIFKLTGVDNNSEYLFNACSMGGTWNSFLYDEQDTASDQFVNFWFNNCRYWCSSTWIDIKKGGHIKLNNCDISGYQPSEDTYLYKFGNGSIAQGTSVFIDEGSRYELKSSYAKVLQCIWDNGLIHFNNVDMSSQWNDTQIEKCFDILTNTNKDIIRFTNSKLFGKFYIHTSANNYIRAEVVIENCQISKTINDVVEFYTPYTYAPSLRIINSTFVDDSTYTIYNTLLKNTEMYTGNVFTRKIYSYNPNGATSSILKKYHKPYYIEMVAFGKEPRTYDNNTTIKVKCLLGKITAINSTTNVKVSDNDLKHFRKNMPIEINGVANTVSGNNFGSKTVSLQTADSTMAVGDDIYLILFNHQSNAYFGQEVNEERCHWLLYNDLLYEATASTVGDLLYEIIE